MTYKKAGVDRKSGDEASFKAYELAKKTYRKEVEEVEGIPYFGAGFKGYKNPCLLAGADGVGTKLKIAFEMGIHDTVGIDLVAMSVNDLIRRGAEPIIFLPYLASSKIVPKKAEEIARGITEGCRIAGCSILGGETAELPDFYKRDEYDLAGSAIGVVEKDKIITGEEIREGDVLVGLASSGLHSNGFSLARKVLLAEFDLNEKIDELGGKSLGEEMLIPTKIYVKSILALLRSGVEIHGMAHITGGGIMEKLGKIIPKGMVAKMEAGSWKIPAIFKLIEKKGGIEREEMFRTFNMGLGMILVVPKSEVKMIKKRVKKARVVGKVEANSDAVVIC
ncbi:phosphoribosylformylglycinamidine cyclo-ligase [Patescibacteria group bacterium]|nr:phosphoribosylformylglycinamidine cyclo-ligase [Patescibacteria group bacterium]